MILGEDQEENTAMEDSRQEIRSQLSQMLAQEDENRRSHDHKALRETLHPCAPNLIWRERVSQWCYDVVDHLGESRDIVYVAMNVLDRYCIFRSASSSFCSLDEREYEIAALTALFLAVRITGTANLELPQLMGVSRLGVSIREILDIGKSMTESLSWEHRLITPLNFVERMLDLLDVCPSHKSSIFESASYLVEVSVCDAFFSGMHSCKVSYAAVCNASGLHKNKEFHRYMSELMDSDDDEIGVLRLRLYHIYAQSEENRDSAPHVIPEGEDDEIMVAVPLKTALRIVSPMSPSNAGHDQSVSPSPSTESMPIT